MIESDTAIRSYLIEELRTELTGPHEPNEILRENPINYYLTGILYPRNSRINPEEDQDAGEAASDDEIADKGVILAAISNPSALGLTCVVPSGSDIKVAARAAIYVPAEDGDGKTWQRKVLQLPTQVIRADSARNDPRELSSGLSLFVRLRPRENRCVVTVSLVNMLSVQGEEYDASHCFFQTGFEVTAAETEEALFLPRAEEAFIHERDERLLNELLYRHAPEYAVGHGCAVNWVAGEDGNATTVRTAIIPQYELLQFSPDPDVPFRAQEMQFLAEASDKDLIEELHELPHRYRSWIDALKPESVSDHLRQTALVNIEQCRTAAHRIEEGIALIENDQQVRLAFRLANQAMLLQRGHILWIRRDDADRPAAPVLDESHRWRPFQLAFFLLTLPAIADSENRWREVVDLLWFPTGGGKTEAYLALTAFTIFLRRLRLNGDHRSAGVTVLMRYTLRLLTIQQYQRAATLIMACEYLRRTRADVPGEDEISLGLWVGGGATPNWLRDAATALKELEDGERVFEGNPYQIRSCPWCGIDLKPYHYKVEGVLTIECPNTACDFAGRIPLYLVDEDIYNRRPTLLIGTVDKFARLPWLGETSSIFGGINTDQLPPELIIQDELHLISGPLGTLVGLYETAVDVLCSKSGNIPKIVASTATIRRAAEQTRHLFNRDLAQFPAPALDARDNFFSRQVLPEERPGRCYVGVHAAGRSMKTSLLRIYAILLQRITEHTASEAVRDPYWTLVGYFNSMRELGGAVRLVEDDVRAHINLLAQRKGVKRRFINDYQELNSRIGSDQIPEILRQMERTLYRDKYPLDVLLATNMISVGVDVDRLGLMVVAGQPKTTSEYIQATSRVGRLHPGLVVTLYNWTRPRDRSHYERFRSYHSALYSQVEPTSVTPFSNRARDRGLHGVFITLMRHLSEILNPDEAAHHFDSDSALARHVQDLILERVGEVDPDELEETRLLLEDISRRWDLLAEKHPLPYGSFRRKQGEINLMVAAEEDDIGMMFPTLNSLREVEGESGIFFPDKRARKKV